MILILEDFLSNIALNIITFDFKSLLIYYFFFLLNNIENEPKRVLLFPKILSGKKTFGAIPLESDLSSQTFLAYNQVGEYNKGGWRWP